MNEYSDQGAAGNAANKDGAAGKGNNPYSHLGIEDADYQAYREGKLTDADLLGIANAASFYQAASGSGAGTFLYQNEAHKRAASIRAKYDPNYIKNDTYDYTHGGRYDPNRVEPMPGLPKYEVLTSLPKVVNQEAQALGKNGQGQEQGVTPTDLLAAVIEPKHLQTLQKMNEQFMGLLTDEQRQRINNGESVFLIIPTLDEEKQAQIVQWEQTFLSTLDPEQKKDVMFLGSGLLDGRDLATRQAILNRLKKNEGKITYEDLVDLGVCEPGTLSENGFVRWLQNFMGGPDIFADMLEKEYQLITDFGMTFGIADQEYRQQFEAQRAMAVTLLIAPALGSLADRVVNGSALSPKEMYNPNSCLDNIEQDGWSIKGPQIPAPEAAESPGGQPAGPDFLKPQSLMDELTKSGVKYNPEDVVTVIKTPDGKLTWLENGNSSSGLKHIVDGHASHFGARGVNDIPSFLNSTLQQIPVKTGMTKAGPYAEYLIDGSKYKVAYGTNGYIVSFYPID